VQGPQPSTRTAGEACPHCASAQPRDAAAVKCESCQGLLLVDGRYRVGSKLGRGGLSVVFEGVEALSGKRVAIKVVSLESAREWKGLELFERGTQIVQNLQHPALPKISAFVRDERGRMYQVREIMDGGSLESRVRDGKRFDRRQVHWLLKGLLEVVDYLQQQTPAILHRDIKPGNVMFRAPSEIAPVLVDFDCAALREERGTQTTIVVSPGYTAPEQLMGDTQPASDLYSVGMTMLFALSHQPPNELQKQHGRFMVSELLAPLEPATAHVLGRLIEPDLTRRYTHARAALKDLRGHEPFELRPSRRTKPTFWNRKLEFGGVSLFRIGVGLLLGAILYFTMLVRCSQEREAEAHQVRGIGAER
jgi:serine/threonine protein kinase